MPRVTVTQNGIQYRVKVFRARNVLRITIPKDIWKQLGEPSEFLLDVKEGKIVLTPIKS